MGNPGFDLNRDGWTPYGDDVTLSRVTPGRGGSGGALEIRRPSSGSFGCDDSPNWVSQVAGAGARYKVMAWVRSLDNTAEAKIRMYELSPSGSQIGSTRYSDKIRLKTDWQLLVGYITVERATSALSIRITEETSSSNKSFQVDDISIELLPPPIALSSGEAEGLGRGLEFRARVEPNPVRGEAFLRMSTTRTGWLRVRLFDVSGREVRRLIDERNAEPGERSLAIGGHRSGIRPGMYFYRVEAPEGTLRGRVVILN